MNNSIKDSIKKFYDVNILNDVLFDWGEQHWLQLEPNLTKAQPVVSIATIYPKLEQPPHNHFGYHEIIIGLDGTCVHWCNNRKITLSKGKIGYISSDSQHHIINFSDKPASFISIIYSHIPETLTNLSPVEDFDFSKLAKRINMNLLIEQFMNIVHMNIFFIDTTQQFMAEKRFLLKFCQLCIAHGCGNCMLIQGEKNISHNKSCVFQCKYGIVVYQTPIIASHKVLGYLSCGYGKLSDIKAIPPIIIRDDMRKAYEEVPFISRNHLTSVSETLSLISTSFVRLVLNHMKEEELNKYKISLAEERENQMRLTEVLNQTHLKFLESQVNPHFLFNTLNTIAQQAVLDGADKIASLTYSLSSLLRLSLGKEKSLLPVSEEIKYIKDYLYIQQTRFPHKFTFECHVDPVVEERYIPLMTLMVLVENSILHGFKNISYKGHLKIRGYIESHYAMIEVSDNGCGIPAEILKIIEDLPKTQYNQIELKGIGIKNIFLRLKHYYEDDFIFVVSKNPGGGTLTKIGIPLEEKNIKEGM